jgi:hypothetical protein
VKPGVSDALACQVDFPAWSGSADDAIIAPSYAYEHGSVPSSESLASSGCIPLDISASIFQPDDFVTGSKKVSGHYDLLKVMLSRLQEPPFASYNNAEMP